MRSTHSPCIFAGLSRFAHPCWYTDLERHPYTHSYASGGNCKRLPVPQSGPNCSSGYRCYASTTRRQKTSCCSPLLYGTMHFNWRGTVAPFSRTSVPVQYDYCGHPGCKITVKFRTRPGGTSCQWSTCAFVTHRGGPVVKMLCALTYTCCQARNVNCGSHACDSQMIPCCCMRRYSIMPAS